MTITENNKEDPKKVSMGNSTTRDSRKSTLTRGVTRRFGRQASSHASRAKSYWMQKSLCHAVSGTIVSPKLLPPVLQNHTLPEMWASKTKFTRTPECDSATHAPGARTAAAGATGLGTPTRSQRNSVTFGGISAGGISRASVNLPNAPRATLHPSGSGTRC